MQPVATLSNPLDTGPPAQRVRHLPWLVPIRRNILLVLITIGGVIYVGNAWTPSHYGSALAMVGVSGQGPLLGEARSIRSDEWAVLTPYFQIAVNNGFARYNRHSPYHEDLRSFSALPLWDWSLAFKPQLWGFFLFDPAYAYSLYHYLMIVAFVCGYVKLLMRFGVDSRFALAISLALFFSRFTQLWWTNNAPVLALAPWVLIVYLSRWRWYIRLPLLFYAAAVWLFSLVYPPFIIATAFVFAVLILAFHPQTLRPVVLLPSLAAVALSAGLIWLYFGPIVQVMEATVYPGSRIATGGGEPWIILISHVFPYMAAIQFQSLLPSPYNECEISTVSSFLPLMAMIFVDHRALANYVRQHRWPVMILVTGLGMMLAWMALPVPAEIGRLLLWHVVPAHRMLWGFGLLLTLAIGVILGGVPWRISTKRALLFVALVLAGWLFSKSVLTLPDRPLLTSWFDLAVLLPLAVLAAAAWWSPQMVNVPGRPRLLLGSVAVLTSIATFGTFNPIQSAKPIFDVPESPQLAAMRELAAAHPRGWLAMEGHYGAVLNGLGIGAINHVLLMPQLGFFRAYFPDLDSQTFDTVFNRYSHVSLALEPEARTVRADLIQLPLSRFSVPLSISFDQYRPNQRTEALPAKGYIDSFVTTNLGGGRWRVILRGWAPLAGIDQRQSLHVSFKDKTFPGVIEQAWAMRVARPDVATSLGDPALNLAGFVLSVELRATDTCSLRDPAYSLLVTAADPRLGEFSLNWPAELDFAGTTRIVACEGSIDAVNGQSATANHTVIRYVEGWASASADE